MPSRLKGLDLHALRVFSLYGAACGVVGEWFPFTQVPMYAELGRSARTEAAVPIFRVDGARVDWQLYQDFVGPDPDDILPWARCRANGNCAGIPSSDLRDRLISDWIRSHPGTTAGPARVEVLYIHLLAHPDGHYDAYEIPVWTGTARPRP